MAKVDVDEFSKYIMFREFFESFGWRERHLFYRKEATKWGRSQKFGSKIFQDTL
ncbi:MAG: hypothetical protein Q6367_012930 [Candidatus Freyarchaeota archaeon]